jgi:hypothetical protein
MVDFVDSVDVRMEFSRLRSREGSGDRGKGLTNEGQASSQQASEGEVLRGLRRVHNRRPKVKSFAGFAQCGLRCLGGSQIRAIMGFLRRQAG